MIRSFATLPRHLLIVLGLPLAWACLVTCGPRPPATQFGSGLPPVAPGPGVQQLEQQMFQRLNRDRRANGLPPLEYDPRLAGVARYHSRDMRDHHFFEHESPESGSLHDRLNRAGYLFLTARENLSEAPDVEKSQDSLLKSPSHHANIMSTDVTHVGIGIVKGGVADPNNLTVTQVFARPGRAESPEKARAAIAASIGQARQGRGLPPAERHPRLNDLAERHLEELTPDGGSSALREVGKKATEALAAEPRSGLAGVLVAHQLLAESSSFQVPDRLLEPGSGAFGLAVRTVPGEGGRPMLQVLLLIGIGEASR